MIRIGDVELDKDAKEVRVNGKLVKMTATEYGILQLLMENAGKVFSIDEIYERVWNESSFSPENTVSVHIRRIREKIEINPKEPRYLKVVWGIGYKIEKSKLYRLRYKGIAVFLFSPLRCRFSSAALWA